MSMNEKMSAAIKTITLNEKTYHNVTFNPTLINFFFGKNGVGKSTIADTIRNLANSPELSRYDVLVYDREFIARNIKEDEAIPGVFSVNEDNIDKQNQIAEKQEQLENLRKDYKDKKESFGIKEKERDALKGRLIESCWKITEETRTLFPSAIKGKKGSKAMFVDELLKVQPQATADIDKLKSLYETAYNADSTQYSNLQPVDVLNENDISGNDLLSIEIISSSDKPFATFIRAIGAADWLHQGHDKFTDKAAGNCPYCGRPLQEDFEEQFSLCFDKQYEADIAKLTAFIDEYNEKANSIIAVLEKNIEVTHPKIDLSKYNAKLETLKAVINLNKKKLSDKLNAPASIVSIDSLDKLLCEINALISEFNIIIEEHNSIVSSRQGKQEECKTAVWRHMAFLAADDIASYNKSLADAYAEMDRLKSDMSAITSKGNDLKNEISALSKQISGIDSAMESINKMLHDSGFQGFQLQKAGVNDEDKNKYMIVRDDKLPAHGLSEGERNFIAFLYFYQKVLGTETSGAEFKNRIVVIDDPVSSMDSSSLFIVSSIVRELIDNCYNNAQPAKSGAPNFIKQVFVLTHNAYFHREISYDRVKYFHCVNFYLIKKYDNVSTIELCIKKDPFSDEPAIEHNYDPVQNSYAALWHEYNEVKSSVALIRVVRQILEYYFIQISGYGGTELRKRILKDESIFINKNSDGTENRDLLQSVNALLRYIGSDSWGFNDGLNFIEGSEDTQRIKDTFERIFKAMGQEQHYQMMMDAVK